MADTDVQCEKRDAEFDETPMGGGVCPLLTEIALFPVRYAIDEAPSQAGGPAPHPLSSPWQGPDYPDLATRGYTLRQLRDGWLYVWIEENGEQRIDEYPVEGATFGGQPHLTYSTRAKLALAYSPVPWTERIQAYMLADAQARQRVMRPVDLMAALAGTAQQGGEAFPAHVGPLTQLAEHVADITPNGAADGFTSTTVSTIERGSGAEEEEDNGVYEVLAVKPEITRDSVLSQVDKHDEALFVALDDDLGIVNDLTMALLGREAELEAFDDEHGHQLQTARVVQELCLVDIDDLIDDEVRHDPERYRDAITKTGELLDALASMDFGSDHTLVAKEMHARRLREELRELGMANPPGRHSPQYQAWHAKELPRLDVKLDDAIGFIAEKGPQFERLQTHVETSLDDLIVWLERLPISAQELCFDTCDAEQNQAMIELAAMVTEVLGATQKGRAWLNGTIRERDSLIGLAMMNFDPVLAEAFDTINEHYLTTGTADGEPADSGISATSVAARVKAGVGVLNLESVQNSRIYQNLAPPIQEAFETLRQGVGGASKRAWETLAYQFLPALSAGGQVSMERAAKALTHSLMIALVHPDIQPVDLVHDPEFEAKHRRWRARDLELANRIRGVREASRRPGYSPHERRTQMREWEQLERQRQELALREPKRITAAANDSGDPGFDGSKGRADNLASVGYHELREQHRLKVAGGARTAHKYMKSWIERSGGGLALLIAALNLYNFMDAVDTAARDGMDGEGLRKLSISAGYAAGAVMSLWVMPFWNAHAKQTAMLSGQLTKVVGAGVTEWLSVNEIQTARLAAKLATRAAGLAAIGAISAGLDTWQNWKQIDKATSTVESGALWTKFLSTAAMTGISGAQLLGAMAGRWFAFGWIMASWATIALFGIGVIYLLASHIAARYNREGVRGWLHTGTWGKDGSKWPDTDEGHADEWREMMEILLQPVVKLTPVRETTFETSSVTNLGVGDINTTHHGFWLQLALPPALAGETVKISEFAKGGFWAPADSFEESPFQQGASRNALPTAAEYDAADMRVWQAWIPASELSENEPFTLAVDYRETLLASPNGRADFTFYKRQAASGKQEIDPNSEDSQRMGASARFALAVPATPEEQG